MITQKKTTKPRIIYYRVRYILYPEEDPAASAKVCVLSFRDKKLIQKINNVMIELFVVKQIAAC